MAHDPETPQERLDGGYSVDLQTRALTLPKRSCQITFLLSAAVQNEIEKILTHGCSTSLDVERRIARDKRSETQKMTSVTRASRSAMLEQYRLERAEHNQILHSAKHAASKVVTLGWHALAVKKRSDIAPRPRGRMWWEHDVSDKDASSWASRRDAEAFQAYKDENEAE